MLYRVFHVVFGNFRYNRNLNHLSELFGMAFSVVSGGLHATSWNSHFPSRIEALLWRIACVGIGVFPIATYLVALSGDGVDATVHAI
jgi:hypothetical protein